MSMPKINQEEYEVLKGLNDKWKWIARNYNGALITYTDKPTKNPNLYWDSFGERMDDRLFQFIQWEDESPYNIAELIEEYEDSKEYKDSLVIEYFMDKAKESEEKEVKDLEWAKNEIKGLMTEESQSYPHDKMIEQEIVLGILKQLEVETLSPEFIDKHSWAMNKFGVNTYAVPVGDLENLLVPKDNTQEQWQEFTEFLVNERVFGHEDRDYLVVEKPVIPQFVANAMARYENALEMLVEEYFNESTEEIESDDLQHWIDNNFEKLCLAYKFGYTVEVEQEPKYYVQLPLANGEVLELYESVGKINFKDINVGITGAKVTFTEQEIKDYDERFWPFAVKAEELEE